MLSKFRLWYQDLTDDQQSPWLKPVLTFALVLFVLSLIPRFIGILSQLPIYSIDENELVEFSVAYFGGDFDPHWYKYGPLYSYMLFFIYKIVTIFGVSEKQFVSDVFLDPTLHYYLARALNGVVNITTGFYAYKIAKDFFGKKVAVVALLLALFPFLDLMVGFKIRVDSLLGLFSVLCLYNCLKLAKNGSWLNYGLAAIFWGCSIATKPLPGLLILPTVLLAHTIGFIQDDKLNTSKKFSFASVFACLMDVRILAFPIIGVAFNFIVHPYSFINFESYKLEQIEAVKSEGSRDFTMGWDITRFFNFWGVAFTLLGFLAVIYLIYRSYKSKNWSWILLSTYFVTFWGAFAMGAARDYFYVPLVPCMVVALALGVVDLAGKLTSQKQALLFVFAICVLLVAQPMFLIVKNSLKDLKFGLDPTTHTAYGGRMWMEQNINPKSNILMLGFYTSLPRVVCADVDHYGAFTEKYTQRSMWGEYFMYGRWYNEYLRNKFYEFHQKLKSDQSTVMFENMTYFKTISDNARVFEQCVQSNTDYLVTTLDFDTIQMFKNHKLTTFDPDSNFHFGTKINIYKLGYTKADLASNPVTDADFYNNAVLAFKLNDLPTAISSLDKAIALNNSNMNYYRMKSQYELNARQFTQALTTLDSWMKVDTSAVSEIAFSKGLAYYNSNDWKNAGSAFALAASKSENNIDAYFNASLCYMNDNNLVDAEKQLKEILKIDEKHANSLNSLANIYERKGDAENAIKYFTQYAEASNDPSAFMKIGQIQLNKGKSTEAISMFTKAIKVNANLGQAYFLRGMCYKNLNIKSGSCEDFKKASSLGIAQANAYLAQCR